MRFINQHRRVIAMVAVFSFIYLIHVGTCPLPAAVGTSQGGQTSITSGQDDPGAIERSAPSGSYAKKKSSPIIPILIGVVVVGAVAAVLILVVFKTKYDITGNWTGSMSADAGSSWTVEMTFTGDKKSGSVFYQEEDGDTFNGTYTVDKKNVSITLTVPLWPSAILTGQFDTKDTMSGTWTQLADYHGNWNLTRVAASAAGIAQTKTGNKRLGTN